MRYNCSCGSKNINFIEANEHWRAGHMLSKRGNIMTTKSIKIKFEIFCARQFIGQPEIGQFKKWLGDEASNEYFESVWFAKWWQFQKELFKKD